ncbi:F-BAR domain only protein 2 [Rhizophlyctis rosea]|nr:F-BAR domain only protein 2 [Rhizophlyctis rosea]
MGFAEAFSYDKPKETVELVLGRVKRGSALEDVVTGYFRERSESSSFTGGKTRLKGKPNVVPSYHRAAIEEAYAASLTRLARKPVPVELGTFAPVWEQLTASTVEVSQLHSAQAKDLAEIAKSTGNQGDPDMQWAKQHETELVKGAKEVEEKLAKYHKAAAKAKKKGNSDKQDKKTADAHAAAEHMKSQWQPNAAQAFQKLQTIDEKRLSNIKDSIVRFAQSDAKHGSSRPAISDALLAAALNFDVTNEMESFLVAKSNLTGDPTHAYTGEALSSAGGSAAPSRHGSVVIPTQNGQAGPVSAGPLSAAPSITPSNGPAGAAPLVDEEGYTIPPPSSRAPWETEMGGSGMIDLDEDDEHSDSRSMTPSTKLKVDIRQQAIVENPHDAMNTMKKFASTLPSVPTTRRKNTRRMSDSPSLASAEGLDDLIRKRTTFAPSIHSSITNHTTEDPFQTTNHSPLRTASPITNDDPLPLRISITETVNVLLKGGVVDKLLVTGEVSVQVSSGWMNDGRRRGGGRIRLGNAASIGKVITNDAFARSITPDTPHDFALDLDAVARSPGLPVVILKYQVAADPSTYDAFAPVFVTPAWKCEERSTALVLVYQINDAVRNRGITLRDLSFFVTCEGGGKITNVQSKPNAVWNAERRALFWKVDADTDGGAAQKLLARVETGEVGRPGTVAVRFASSGSLLSGVDVGVVEEGSGGRVRVEGVSKAVVSGKYGAAEA